MCWDTPENEKVEQEIDHILGFDFPCYQYGSLLVIMAIKPSLPDIPLIWKDIGHTYETKQY